MSIHRRSLSLGSSLLLGACFSPGAQLTGTTGEPGTDTTATATATMGSTSTSTSTSEPTTADPTSGTTSVQTTSTTDPTGGACPQCESPTPHCMMGECIGCEQLPALAMSCSDIDVGTPLCDAGDLGGTGSCVACLESGDCVGNGLKCDPQTHTCVPNDGPCQNHVDCSGACEIDTGVCFPPEARHYFVANSALCGDSPECTDVQPCCVLGAAMTAIAADGGTHHIVHVASGSYSKGFALTPDGVRVAVLAADGTVIEAEAGNPVITVGVMPPSPLDTKLYLQGLTITGIGSAGVVCQSIGFLGLDDITVRDLEGSGLLTAECTVWSRRSQFLRNHGGLSISASTVRLENSIVSGSTTTPALTVVVESKLEVLYSTIAQQSGVPKSVLSCPLENAFPPGSVNIRNSAVLNAAVDLPVDCAASITTANSVVSSPLLNAGPPAGNKELAVDQVSPIFVDWIGSDLHVADNVTELNDVAVWKTGDPITDLDGEVRPNEDQAADVAGADVPVG